MPTQARSVNPFLRDDVAERESEREMRESERE